MKNLTLFLFAAALTFKALAQPQFQFTTVASGLTLPLYVTHAGDERLFVIEKQGMIKIIMPGGTVNATPFLDITGIVRSSSSVNNEQGLLGLAFHPDYKNNGYFYVNYTRESPANDGGTVIARYTVSANDSNIADPNSAEIILNVPQPYANHNGGCIQFGNDGYLYIGMGDGGSAGDPDENGQDPLALLGKMLRIDVNTLPYAIPSSNPFYGFAGTRNEIWAVGVRNPWRFSFDRITHDMWMGDVGQNAVEELNFEPADSGGRNYGWDCYEGTTVFEAGCGTTGFTDPFYEYNHNTAGGYSVTGGYVYRSAKYKGAWGYYLFADAVNQHLWATIKDGNNFTTTKPMNGTAGSSNVSFGQDVYGDLYIVKHSGGTVQKISETGTKQPKAYVLNGGGINTLCEGDAYELFALLHPDLNYEWQKDGQTISGTNNSASYQATESGDYRVIVTDPTVAQSIPDTSEITQVVIVPASISSLQQSSYNADVNDAAFQITTTIQGGTFTGPGVDANGLFTPSQAGLGTHEIVYTITTTNCPQRDTAFVTVTGTVGIAGINENTEINIFPNPGKGKFNISSTAAIQKLSVMNIVGEEIFTAQPNNHNAVLYLHETAKGIYFVKVESKAGAYLKKIILE